MPMRVLLAGGNMGYSEDIQNALIAHGQWKQQLASAITNGKSEFSVATVQADNACAFGKWFYALPSRLRESEQAKKIQRLHASFHSEAGRILSLALNGRRDEGAKAIGPGSQYTAISGQLAIAMTQWQKELTTVK
jgi:hypothetical protein